MIRQKSLEKFWYNVRRFPLKKKVQFAIATILSLIVIFMIFGVSRAATYSFLQTNWLTQTTNVATHTAGVGGPPSWTEYAAKDADMDTTGGQLGIIQQVQNYHEDGTSTPYSFMGDFTNTQSGSNPAGALWAGVVPLPGGIKLKRLPLSTAVNTIDFNIANAGSEPTQANGSIMMLDRQGWARFAYLNQSTVNDHRLYYVEYNPANGTWNTPGTLLLGSISNIAGIGGTVDKNNGVHLVVVINTTVERRLRYYHCASNCTNAASWSQEFLDAGDASPEVFSAFPSSSYPQPALWADNASPQMLHVTYGNPTSGDGSLKYRTCVASTCGVSGTHWGAATRLVRPSAYPIEIAQSLYIRTDSNNRPRILSSQNGEPLAGDVIDGNPRLWWCDSGCSNAANWLTGLVYDFGVNNGSKASYGFSVAPDNTMYFSFFQTGGSNLWYKQCSISGSTLTCTPSGANLNLLPSGSSGDGKFSAIIVATTSALTLPTAYDGERALRYTTCQSSCTSSANWTVANIGMAQYLLANVNIRDTVQALTDDQSTPHIHYISGTSNLQYVTPNFVSGTKTYTSSVRDLQGQGVTWNNISWVQTQPPGTTIALWARTSNDPNMAGATMWGAGCAVSNGGSIGAVHPCVHQGDRYIQYQVTMTGTAPMSPMITSMRFNYTYTPSSVNLTSSQYNTTDSSVVLTSIQFDRVGTIPAGARAKFQIKTATSQATLVGASFIGPDGTTGTYFQSDNPGTCTLSVNTYTCNLPANPFGLGNNDQWFQYRATLDSSGAGVPIIDTIRVSYVINTAPTVTVSGASQSSSGAVAVNYSVSDPEETNTNITLLYDTGITLSGGITQSDTIIPIAGSNVSLLPSSGVVQIENEQIGYTGRTATTLTGATRGIYNTLSSGLTTRASLHASGQSVLFKAVTVGGNIGGGVLNGSRSVTWTPISDIPGLYNAGLRVRVASNDGNLANQIGFSDSSAFVLDTKDPVIPGINPAIQINGGAAKTNNASGAVTLALNASDDTALQMRLSDDGVFDSEVYEAYSISRAWTLAGGDAIRTINVLFMDAKGNQIGPYLASIMLDRTAPQTPTGLSAAEVSNPITGDVKMLVSWCAYGSSGACPAAPVDASGAGDFAHYILERSTSGPGGPFTQIRDEVDINANSYIDTICNTVCVGAQVSYRLKSIDNITNESAYSAILTVVPTGTTPDIAAPSITSISLGSPGVNYRPISWYASESPSSDKSDSSVLYTTAIPAHGERDFTDSTPKILNNTLIGSGIEHLVYMVGLTPSQNYSYQVRSRDQSGNVGKATTTPETFQFPSIDTTLPLITGVTVTPTAKSAVFQWTTDKPASSLIDYGGGLYGDFRFSTSHTVVVPATLTPGAPLNYTIYARDIIGNESNTTGSYITASATDSTAPVISVIVPTPSTRTATITWTTDEPASSYVEYGTTQVGGLPIYNSIVGEKTFGTSHSVQLPQNLTPDTTYFYRVRSIDGSGNEAISTGQNFSTIPLVGAPDITAPTILSVNIVGAGLSSALITWTTSEPANSQVEYSENSVLYDKSRTTPELTTMHSIELADLKVGVLYRFRIKSRDAAGNEGLGDNGGAGYPFATLGSSSGNLTISGVQVTIAGRTTTITWTTNEAAVGFIEYGFTKGYSEIVASSLTPATSHSVTLPSDILGEIIYNFQVRARGADGRQASSQQVAVFTTPPSPATVTASDTTKPVISQVVVPLVTTNSAVITWITDEAATTLADYGLTNAYGFIASSTPGLLGQTHSVTLTGLQSGSVYYFRVSAQDANGNLETKATDKNGILLQFTTTTPPPGAPPPPPNDKDPPQISNVQISNITSKGATITWSTNEDSNTLVEYGIESGTYTDLAGDTGVFTSDHTVDLKNLTGSTTYYFLPTSFDQNGNKGVGSELSFMTLGSTADDALADLKKKLEIEAEQDKLDLITKLLGLSSSTQEVVKNFIEQLDLLGEDERSQVLEILFGQLVGPPQILGTTPTVTLTDTTATIGWQTIKDTNGTVLYAEEKYFKPNTKNPYAVTSGDPKEYSKEHSITLVGLESATIYHYQLQGEEKFGKRGVSIDRTFRTLPRRPNFAHVKVSSVNEESVVISWDTNIPAEGVVEYTDTGTKEKKSQGDPQLKKAHEITLIGLKPKTKYVALVTAKTEDDVTIKSNLFSFTTGVDATPPEIAQVRTKLSLVAGKTDVVQAVISWNTNEPADGQLFYDEGFTKGEIMRQSSPLQADLTTYHVVVLSKLRPGTVYRFQAVSRDASKNDGPSQEFKIITPRKQESVLELIIENFEDTFGFLQNINK